MSHPRSDTTRCPHCSKLVSTIARNCAHCGKALPVAPRPRSPVQCVRCGVDTELVSVGPIEVDRCTGCGNIWFDTSELERLSAEADGAVGAEFRKAVRCLLPVQSSSAGPALLRCSLCPTVLIRRAHPTVPGVLAHVCALHGAWLERHHLLTLIDEIEKHGVAELRARQQRRLADSAPRQGSLDGPADHTYDPIDWPWFDF